MIGKPGDEQSALDWDEPIRCDFAALSMHFHTNSQRNYSLFFADMLEQY
jgi:hypothetical protein